MIRETLVRYRVAWLGLAWTLLPTLTLLFALTLAFSNTFQGSTGENPYFLFTLAGLVPWTFTTAAISRSATALVGNSDLVTRVYVPREVFPVAALGVRVFDFGIGLVLFWGLSLWTGHFTAAGLVYLPLVLAVHLAFLFAAALLLSAVAVPVRDVTYAMNYITLIGLFLTPVCYPLQSLSPGRRFLLHLNPMTPIIEAYRDVLLRGEPPFTFSFLGVSVFSFLLAVGAYFFFKRIESRIVEIL